MLLYISGTDWVRFSPKINEFVINGHHKQFAMYAGPKSKKKNR